MFKSSVSAIVDFCSGCKVTKNPRSRRNKKYFRPLRGIGGVALPTLHPSYRRGLRVKSEKVLKGFHRRGCGDGGYRANPVGVVLDVAVHEAVVHDNAPRVGRIVLG